MDIKSIFDKWRKRSEAVEPAEPPELAEQLPPIWTFNCDSNPDAIMVVQGHYNAVLVRGFGIPVVGLQSWHPSYRDTAPFAKAKRIEIVISRVRHNVKPTEEFRQIETTSADFGLNVKFLQSFVEDQRICERAVVSNSGVFSMAQRRRVFGTNPLAREEYIKEFYDLPTSAKAINAMCMPSRVDVMPEPSPTPYLSPDYLNYKVNPYSPQIEASSGSAKRFDDVTMTMLASVNHEEEPDGFGLDVIDRSGWNPPPTAEEKKSMKDWNKT